MVNSTSDKKLNRSGNRRGMSLNSHKNIVKAQEVLRGNNHAKKDYSITRIQRGMLPLPCPYAQGKTWAEWLAERGMALAAENAAYYRELLDRLEGKVTQPIGGEGGEPIKTEIIVSSETAKNITNAILSGKRT